MTDDILGTFEHIDAALAVGTPVSRGAVPHFAPPEAEAAVRGVNTSEIPQTLGELGELISYSYDLSVKQAGDLNIPVVGDVSGGFDRRVVVLEWTRYKTLFDADSVEYRYGYVIRFCLTVSKWEAQTQVRLPFLAAQAELGNIQASWLMQIRGLTGEKIDGVVLPPQELDVSTFAIAKQSLEAAIGAVKDPTTKFIPGILLATIDPTAPDVAYWTSAVKTFALSNLRRGRSRSEAIARLGSADPAANDVIAEVYTYLGITDPTAKPSAGAREAAQQILRGISADV